MQRIIGNVSVFQKKRWKQKSANLQLIVLCSAPYCLYIKLFMNNLTVTQDPSFCFTAPSTWIYFMVLNLIEGFKPKQNNSKKIKSSVFEQDWHQATSFLWCHLISFTPPGGSVRYESCSFVAERYRHRHLDWDAERDGDVDWGSAAVAASLSPMLLARECCNFQNQ